MCSDPVAVLRRAFGYPGFRPGQEELVRAVLGRRDALGILPTGGGKSLCYQVPARMIPGLTLVVTPLISLMQDQVERARTVGLAADALSAAQSPSERRGALERATRSELDLLFVSPERLAMDAFRELVGRLRVDLLAVDEAHCISEWGHDFRPAYRKIGAMARRLGCPTLALTASATPAVRDDIRESLGLTAPVEVLRSFDRANLWWAVQAAGPLHTRARQTYRLLRSGGGSAIVYAATRRSVEQVRDALASLGLGCDAYHAGLSGAERARVQERFMRGHVRTVVATNAFGMGIDKPDVRTVIHVQLPSTLEAYYQEAGRAGRDGLPARCIALHGRGDRRLSDRFLDAAWPRPRQLKALHRALRRASGPERVLHTGDPDVRKALGGVPEAWIRGEPVGPLAALERAGAIRPVHGDGTGQGHDGSMKTSFAVSVRMDTTPVRDRRRVVAGKIDAVDAYARTRDCRTRRLLRYFGEKRRASCGRCDRCGWDSTAGMPVADG